MVIYLSKAEFSLEWKNGHPLKLPCRVNKYSNTNKIKLICASFSEKLLNGFFQEITIRFTFTLFHLTLDVRLKLKSLPERRRSLRRQSFWSGRQPRSRRSSCDPCTRSSTRSCLSGDSTCAASRPKKFEQHWNMCTLSAVFLYIYIHCEIWRKIINLISANFVPF